MSFQRRRRVEERLRGWPNVIGVGFGWKDHDDTPAWRIYVNGDGERVPSFLEGLPTDVIGCDTPKPALLISNLRGVLLGDGGSGLGRLGFFAAVNGKRQREVVLVSNRHVLLAHGAQRGDPVYHPRFTGENVIEREDPIAEICDPGLEGEHPFAHPGEAEEPYFVDCATARLFRPPPPSEVRGVARLHPLDVVGTRAPRVRKLGCDEVVGRVVDVAAPLLGEDGQRRRNNLVIRSEGSAFAAPGDSGALVVNEKNEAVALVWGRGEGVAYACHIHPVLHRLGVTLLTRGLR